MEFPVYLIGFEILTEMTMKSGIVLDMTACSAVEFRQYFRRTFCLHL